MCFEMGSLEDCLKLHKIVLNQNAVRAVCVSVQLQNLLVAVRLA